MSNFFQPFSHTTMYSNFMFPDKLLYQLLCTKYSHEYSIVAFCKNETLTLKVGFVTQGKSFETYSFPESCNIIFLFGGGTHYLTLLNDCGYFCPFDQIILHYQNFNFAHLLMCFCIYNDF